MSKEKIAIVGSAIAGSAAAILLDRANFEVSVFEQRPKGILEDRGAGIALPKYLVKHLIEEDLLDRDFPIIDVNQRKFIVYDPHKSQERCLGYKPFLAYSVHWGSLYSNLVKRIPDHIIHYDTKVTQITKSEKVTLKLSNGQEEEFDFVIFADGYHSIGRDHLYPQAAPKFSNYIAWRGTLMRVDEETDSHLLDKVPFYLFEKGHLLLYSIPRLAAKEPEKEYIVNWLIYENIDENHPIALDNKAHENVMANNMKPEYRDYLHALAKKYFCPFAQDVIFETPTPFTQAIYDTYVPNYFSDNMALVGDASILARPHVGAGSTKALEDALSLYKHLSDTKDPHGAFMQWGQERQQKGNKLLTLCRDLGSLLVTDMPNWNDVSTEEMHDYWEKTVEGHDDWYQINKKRLEGLAN